MKKQSIDHKIVSHNSLFCLNNAGYRKVVTQNLLQLTEVSDRFKEESLGSGNLKYDEQLPDVVCCRPDRVGVGAYNPDYAVPRICGDELCFIFGARTMLLQFICRTLLSRY